MARRVESIQAAREPLNCFERGVDIPLDIPFRLEPFIWLFEWERALDVLVSTPIIITTTAPSPSYSFVGASLHSPIKKSATRN